jgi:hypothetical protein
MKILFYTEVVIVKIISKMKLQEIKRDSKEAKFVVYTPDKRVAGKLFSVYKPAPHYKGGEYERAQYWIKLVNENMSGYRNVAFYIKDGYVDSYCSLEYFQDEDERHNGKYGEIYQLSNKTFEAGDVVHIKENICMDPARPGHVTSEMFKRCGEFAIIRDTETDGYYKIEEDPFWWAEDLLEPPHIPMIKINGIIVPKSDNIAEGE